MPENSMLDIKRYLDDEKKPLTTDEFTEFWTSLSNEEKEQYKKMELK